MPGRVDAVRDDAIARRVQQVGHALDSEVVHLRVDAGGEAVRPLVHLRNLRVIQRQSVGLRVERRLAVAQDVVLVLVGDLGIADPEGIALHDLDMRGGGPVRVHDHTAVITDLAARGLHDLGAVDGDAALGANAVRAAIAHHGAAGDGYVSVSMYTTVIVALGCDDAAGDSEGACVDTAFPAVRLYGAAGDLNGIGAYAHIGSSEREVAVQGKRSVRDIDT